MASNRRYNLLCPIARALDRVGDRWALLILRDLHAGPARFKDLQTGLTGIAANLLTDRLKQLQADGLIVKSRSDHGVDLYALTELGKQSRDILFELARLGGSFDPGEEIKRPGNLRTIAVTLSAAGSRAVPNDFSLSAHLVIDGECFSITAKDGSVSVTAGGNGTAEVTLETSYEAMLDVSEGRLSPDLFARDHAVLSIQRDGAGEDLMALLSGAIGELHRE